MELDKTFEERETINGGIVEAVDKASDPWGVKVTRYEVKNIVPPMSIKEAMEKQIQVLRKKREELGFPQYDGRLLPGSKAKMLVDKRTSTACKRVGELEEKKTDAISRIWTSTMMSNALSVLDEVKKL